ncbi:cytoskeleton-associated protein 2-like [Paramisgurnus dabryanus]|uniref:cytoskeleton-associated protein 2-like n=1 Tax=Paramisgurnus dabryanus TaxID=90735 RepID=UPI0031F45306
MEGVTDEHISKLSRTEQRKLKLAEYLAAKGRLKPPNPKPYLKDNPVILKNRVQRTETHPKVKTVGDEKENCDTNGANINQTKTVKSLAEVRRKAANSSTKTELCTKPLPRPTYSTILRNAPLQTTVLNRQTNRPAFLQNARELNKTEKPSLSQPLKTHQYSLRYVRSKVQQTQAPPHTENNTQRSTKSSLGPSQPGCGTSVHRRADQNCNKTDLQSKKPLVKKFASVKTTANVNVKTTENQQKSRRPVTNTESKIQTNNVCKPPTRLANSTQQPKVQSVVSKLGINSNNARTMSRSSQPVMDRSNKNQRKDLPCVPKKVDATNKAVVKTRVSSTVSTKSDTTAIIKNNRTAVKPTGVNASRNTKSSVLPQTTTFSQKPKRSSQANPTVQLQTPKTSFCPSTQGVRTAPVDGKVQPTAAQEERLRKLQEWRESRGITYKRPPMPVRLVRRKTVSSFPQPYWTAMEQEDEVHSIVFAVDRSLDDCIKLLQQGFQVEKVRDVLSRIPMAQKFAKYWICQARLMEREGNMEVLPMFQEAVRVVREPVDELRSVVFEILKKNQAQGSSPAPNMSETLEPRADDEQGVPGDIMCTPKPVGALIRAMKGDSSVVKYKITATPGGKRSQQMAVQGHVDGHEIRFFTPVRRSARIEKAAPRYPTALLEHDPCVTSFSDLVVEEKNKGDTPPQNSPVYVYRENEALRDHIQVQLVFPDEVET